MEIFKEIENGIIDLSNDKHCFLLSYRAFAREFHIKKQVIQGLDIQKYRDEFSFGKEESESLTKGSKLAHNDGLYIKKRLNDILYREAFDELEYLTFELDYIVPIAVATSLTLNYDLRGRLFNFSLDPNIRYQYVNLIVQPTKNGKTKIIFSCLPEDLQSVDFLDDLGKLKENIFLKRVSSMIVGYVENAFFSPKIWKNLTLKEKKILFKELYETVFPDEMPTKTKLFDSYFNFFDSKYKLNNT